MHRARLAWRHLLKRPSDREVRIDYRPGAPPIGVLVLCPGGLEHGGGIGRQMGYFLAALPQAAGIPTYRVVDYAGAMVPRQRALAHSSVRALPWGCGAPGRVGGVVSQPTLLHVNITGRGSTTRKLALTAVARAVALPYVLHIHELDYAADVRARGEPMRRLVRGMFAAAAQIIVLGTDADRTLRAALALPDSPVLVFRTLCLIRALRRGRPQKRWRPTPCTSCSLVP